MAKAGDIVRIYEDPLTEKKVEGEAKLIELLSEDTDREYWLVEFTRGHERHPRWIKKSEDRHSPEGKMAQTFCDRLEYFIDEELKGIGEYVAFVTDFYTELMARPGYLSTVYRIIEEQRSHVETLKRINESLCPG